MRSTISRICAAGDQDRAEALWQEVVELAERTQDAVATQWGANIRPTIALLDGRFDDVLEATAPGTAAWDRAAALAYLGRDDEALTLPPRLPDDLAGGQEERYAHRAGGTVATRALRLARSGDLAAAGAILRRFAAIRGLGPASETRIVARTELLETAMLVGDREAVALLATALVPQRHRLGVDHGWSIACIARHLGAAVAPLGQHREAREYYATALEVTAKTRFRPGPVSRDPPCARRRRLALGLSQREGPNERLNRQPRQTARIRWQRIEEGVAPGGIDGQPTQECPRSTGPRIAREPL